MSDERETGPEPEQVVLSAAEERADAEVLDDGTVLLLLLS